MAGLIEALVNTGSFGGSGGDGQDIYKKVLGYNSDELAALGQQQYGDLPKSSRHHAAASSLMSSQLKPALSTLPGGDVAAVAIPQIAGLGVEGAEMLMQILRGINPLKKENLADASQDLQANLRGSIDAVYGR